MADAARPAGTSPLERSNRRVHTRCDAGPTLARQRRALAVAMTVEPTRTTMYLPVSALPLGTWLVMFGGVAELMAVSKDPHPGFPNGRLITVRPVTGGDGLSVLVPCDFCPLAVRP